MCDLDVESLDATFQLVDAGERIRVHTSIVSVFPCRNREALVPISDRGTAGPGMTQLLSDAWETVKAWTIEPDDARARLAQPQSMLGRDRPQR